MTSEDQQNGWDWSGPSSDAAALHIRDFSFNVMCACGDEFFSHAPRGDFEGAVVWCMGA